MSIGGIVGVVAGGVIGWFIGGPAGALYGAGLGFGLGTMIDPMTPDVPSPGVPLPVAAEVMSTTIGEPLPDLVGTAKITGHLLCYGKERTKTVYTEVEGGKGGDSPDPYVSGYEYYMSWAVGIAAGPIDTLCAIYKGDIVVWEGELNIPTDPASCGQETIVLVGEGPPQVVDEGSILSPPEPTVEVGMGSATFYFGTDNQIANSNVGEIIGDETLNSPYRNFCWCFFDDCYIGDFNRCPNMKFVLRKSPSIAFSEDNVIQTYDYNPIHAMWYILHDLAGLPETWLHEDDFVAAATVLKDERRGISCLFAQQQNTLAYLEAINNHIDGIIRYGSDGKFHPKLIRDDYIKEDLPLIDENVMLDDPTLKRKSWIDTINEIKVQYTEIVANYPFAQGKWVAAMSQPDTDFVYLYDITYKAVIKLQLLSPPVVTDTLALEPLYDLDYDMGDGGPGSQHGAYCMNKDGTRLWYLFREHPVSTYPVYPMNCELIEVDISGIIMKVVKKTTFTDLVPAIVLPDTYEAINDGCSDDTHTYWCTSLVKGRIIKIRNSDHEIVADAVFNFIGPIPGSGGSDRGISSMDVDRDRGSILFQFVRDAYPTYNACLATVRSNLALDDLITGWLCGSGARANLWPDMVRAYPDTGDQGYVMYHNAYHPSNGPLRHGNTISFYKFNGEAQVEYLQNMLGFCDDKFFILWHENSVHHPAYLSSVIVTTDQVQVLGSKDVSYYAGQIYPPGGYDWDGTSVSAMNIQTKTIIIVRYNNVEEQNYVACFAAADDITFVSDMAPQMRRGS